MLRRQEGYKPLNETDRIRLHRLIAEMGMNRKLNLYSNRDETVNAAAFGFNMVGFTYGMMRRIPDEELKGVICHEVGHIAHRDYIYDLLLYSMELLGHYCLYGIFLVPALIFGLISSLVSSVIPSVSVGTEIFGRLWWSAYRLLNLIIYGISKLVRVNVNKYGEYRCDAHSLKYGCGEGLLSFLRRVKKEEDVYGERLTFTEYITSTHPATEKRIARLEKRL